MPHKFLIGIRKCVNNKLSVLVKYSIKPRQIFLSTVTSTISINIFDGMTSKIIGVCVVSLVLSKMAHLCLSNLCNNLS